MARFKQKMAEGEMPPMPPMGPEAPQSERTLMEDLKDLLIGFQAENEAYLKMDEHGFIDSLLDQVEKRVGGGEGMPEQQPAAAEETI